jgi:hypothetical protein
VQGSPYAKHTSREKLALEKSMKKAEEARTTRVEVKP